MAQQPAELVEGLRLVEDDAAAGDRADLAAGLVAGDVVGVFDHLAEVVGDRGEAAGVVVGVDQIGAVGTDDFGQLADGEDLRTLVIEVFAGPCGFKHR